MQKIKKFSLTITSILFYIIFTFYYTNKLAILIAIITSTFGLIVPMDFITQRKKILFLSEVDIPSKYIIIITMIKIIIYMLILPFLFYNFSITNIIARYMSLHVILLIMMYYALFFTERNRLVLFVLSLCDIYLPFSIWAAACSFLDIEELISNNL